MGLSFKSDVFYLGKDVRVGEEKRASKVGRERERGLCLGGVSFFSEIFCDCFLVYLNNNIND